MSKRKAYKPLYQQSEALVARKTAECVMLRRRLQEVESTLMPLGKDYLTHINSKDKDVYPTPLEYVAIRTNMDAMSRLTTASFSANGDPDMLGLMRYSWRGTRIHKPAWKVYE
jgi:hypothetical protein